MTEKKELLDLRGLKCPLPVLKAKKALRAYASGAEIWIETTDPLAVIDIPAFCQEDGHELKTTEELSDHHRFLIVKGG